MRIIAGAVGLMVATGHLCARVESPVVSLDKPLPSEALALTCPASGTSEPETSAPGAFRTANLSAADSQSLWAALSEARREIGAVGDAADGALLRAHNPGQRLAVRFMPNAVSVAPSGTNAAWQAFFALDGTAGQPAAVVCRGTRMEYDRGSLIEWYDNQAGGVEHGFILKTRPAGAGPDVRLRVAVGGLQPRLSSDGDAAELADGQGNVLLRYAKLKAWDADGRVLASRMEVGDGAVVLVVADAGARYPVTIDPFITAQQAKLGPEVTGDGAAEDCFGYSVAISGDTALVGAYQDDDKGSNSGSAYVFTRDGTTWSQQAKLIADDGEVGDWFGTSVALHGDTALVGAYRDDDDGNDSGSAYVFTRSDTNWIQQAKLTANDGAEMDYFGYSVALAGDTALVGAYADDDKGSISGSAYVFTRSGSTWTQQAKLTAADGAAGDCFGWSVALSGDTALVGAYADDDNGVNSGSAFVFTRDGTTWNQQAKLTAGESAAGDNFGTSVALSGDTVLIGAYKDDDKGTDSGSAYVFTRDGTNWIQQAKLTADDGATYDYFGYSVALSGDTALVGAYQDDDKGDNSGSAYVFTRSGTTWTQQAKLIANDGTASDWFGTSVALHGDTALVGAYGDDDKGDNSGSAHVFTRDGTNWIQQAKLTASDGANYSYFGSAVALSDDTALVGAYMAVNAAGSAYVFTRDGTNWPQQAKLTAADGAAYDYFGRSVALSGGTALVGADGDDDKGYDSGSAYVFTRDGTTWTQRAKLIADDGAKNDCFGWSVALSDDTALVGAYQDDGLDALGGAAADQGSAYVFTLVDDITVTLDYQYGGITNTLILQTSGTYASLPSATRPLHTFLGWYRTPTDTLEDIQNGVDNHIYPTNTVKRALATLYARWSPFTATRTTPISIRVTALAPFYPGDISQAFPDEVEAYASGNAAAAAYKVWELILLGLNPTDPDVVPTAILAYITFDGSGNAVVHKIPAAGIPSATIYKQWGKQNLADPVWTDLGTQGTPCPPSQPYRFFKITGE